MYLTLMENHSCLLVDMVRLSICLKMGKLKLLRIEFKDAPKGMKTAKLNNCKRIQARKSWIMIEEKIAI